MHAYQHCPEFPIELGWPEEQGRAEGTSWERWRGREGTFLTEDRHGQRLEVAKLRARSEPESQEAGGRPSRLTCCFP